MSRYEIQGKYHYKGKYAIITIEGQTIKLERETWETIIRLSRQQRRNPFMALAVLYNLPSANILSRSTRERYFRFLKYCAERIRNLKASRQFRRTIRIRLVEEYARYQIAYTIYVVICYEVGNRIGFVERYLSFQDFQKIFNRWEDFIRYFRDVSIVSRKSRGEFSFKSIFFCRYCFSETLNLCDNCKGNKGKKELSRKICWFLSQNIDKLVGGGSESFWICWYINNINVYYRLFGEQISETFYPTNLGELNRKVKKYRSVIYRKLVIGEL